MPQNSIPYAAARVSVLSKDALDAGRLERLLSAKTLDEARHTLSEIGWQNADSMDYEQLANAHIKKSCTLIRSITPAPKVTDCFLLQYDIQNLKILFKARCLAQEAPMLSDAGLIPTDTLIHAVADHNYAKLPKVLKDAMDTLEKKSAVNVDPLEIDVILDKAHYESVFESLKDCKEKNAMQYFLAKADITNAIMLLRVNKIGRNAAFFKHIVLPYGTVSQAQWEKAFEMPERIVTLLKPYGKKVVEAAKNAVSHFSALPALEKAMDDRLLAIYQPFKYDPFCIESLIGYLIACQREAAAVRLIMAGKTNNFPNEVIRERMRELYG